ncbi:MAG TPA: carboxypeptidase-like regulatory domain-containing protein, partial [Longimicrobium sp.]|nr:carboxypeptidase-like regulatory domain-containing protein [Longimicrobium sp.]
MRRSVFPSILVLALAALAIAAPAAAQTVEGRLVREEAGVPGIRVVLVDSAGAVAVEGTTDAEGKFTLAAPAPGRYRVRAERAGASAIVSPVLL